MNEPVGLENSYNFCWFNAAMQLLNCLTKLLVRHPQELCKRQKQLHTSLERLFERMSSSNSYPYVPSQEVLETVQHTGLAPTLQQDVVEYLDLNIRYLTF